MSDGTQEVHDVADLTADLFISLDGFAGAVEVGPFFGYGGPGLDEWIQAELDRPQLVVLGRVTYEALAGISAEAGDRLSRRLTDAPKVVCSSTLSEPLGWENTRLVAGDATRTLPAIKADSATPLRTMGSMSLVRSLMNAGLVDRLRLMVFPLTCGSAGRERAFGEGDLNRMRLAATRVLDERVVLLEYLTSDG
ncbi:MAG: dihydrofolate reductase family protein [Solirubrobacteraceae bacterium]